jgi:hypothetical protein
MRKSLTDPNYEIYRLVDLSRYARKDAFIESTVHFLIEQL